MKSIAIVSLAAALLASAPAQALTLEQAMNEVAGMYCSGSTCTSQTPGTREESFVSGHGSAAVGMAIEPGRSSVCFFGNGWAMIDVSPITCQPNSLMLSGGGPIWSTRSVDTITTVTKELIYNGPNTSRDTAWSVVTTTETVDAE